MYDLLQCSQSFTHICGVAGSHHIVVVEEELRLGVRRTSNTEQLEVVVSVVQSVLEKLTMKVLVVDIPVFQTGKTLFLFILKVICHVF